MFKPSLQVERSCRWCGVSFHVTEAQLRLLEKITPVFMQQRFPIPPPTLCPDCRNQRRLSNKNDSVLYARQCSLSGKRILSIYHPLVPVPVYDTTEWWSDAWDARSYARDFDFNRPFFPQFEELCALVPRRNLITANCENCDFCSQIANCKDCYLLASSAENECCLYSFRIFNSRDCLDCLVSSKNELCYECIEAVSCYDCRYCIGINNCSESAFLENCRSCSNCFLCSGLRNRSYCIKNKQLSRTDYEHMRAQYNLASFNAVSAVQGEFAEFLTTQPRLFARLSRVEQVSGDAISNAKDCERVFDGADLEDTHNSQFVDQCRDTADVNYGWQQSLHYEGVAVGMGSQMVAFCSDVWPNVSNLLYCVFCHEGVHDCFACNGLRRAQYCIFNRQYSREDYEQLSVRIIKHMQNTGEWGEFFPPTSLGCGYQESVAMCYYPHSRVEALAKGFRWSEYEPPQPSAAHIFESSELADSCADLPSSMAEGAVRCSASARLFRITTTELEFYKRNGIPLPRLHPHERYLNRNRRRNPRRLWQTRCASCHVELNTACDPAGARPILCQSCFENSAYGTRLE